MTDIAISLEYSWNLVYCDGEHYNEKKITVIIDDFQNRLAHEKNRYIGDSWFPHIEKYHREADAEKIRYLDHLIVCFKIEEEVSANEQSKPRQPKTSDKCSLANSKE